MRPQEVDGHLDVLGIVRALNRRGARGHPRAGQPRVDHGDDAHGRPGILLDERQDRALVEIGAMGLPLGRVGRARAAIDPARHAKLAARAREIDDRQRAVRPHLARVTIQFALQPQREIPTGRGADAGEDPRLAVENLDLVPCLARRGNRRPIIPEHVLLRNHAPRRQPLERLALPGIPHRALIMVQPVAAVGQFQILRCHPVGFQGVVHHPAVHDQPVVLGTGQEHRRRLVGDLFLIGEQAPPFPAWDRIPAVRLLTSRRGPA